MDKKAKETKNILTEWVYKPNQLIDILTYKNDTEATFLNLSLNKRKIMNVLIQTIHNHYELNLEGELFKIQLSELIDLLSLHDYSNKNVVKEVESMMNVQFSTKYKHGFDKIVLFPRVRYDGEDYIEFECHRLLNNMIKNKYCLVDDKGDVIKLDSDKKKHHYYSRLNLELESMFRGKEHMKALIIYEMAVHNIKNIDKYNNFMKDTNTLLEVMGCTSYTRNSDIINKILLPVVEDLKRVGVQLFYKCDLTSSKKIKNIRFYIFFTENVNDNLKRLHRKPNDMEFYWRAYPKMNNETFKFKSQAEYEKLFKAKLTNVVGYTHDNSIITEEIEDEEYDETSLRDEELAEYL